MHRYLSLIPAILMCSAVPAFAAYVPPGSEIQVRPDTPIDVSHWDRGRIYPAHVSRDVVARDGDLVIPRGSYAELIVRQIGEARYALDLESVTVNNQRYVVDTSGPQYSMPRADYDSGNGVVGAIVGAITGATGGNVEANGGEIRIPEGSMVTFRLNEPLHVVNWGDPGYENGGVHYHRDHDWYR